MAFLDYNGLSNFWNKVKEVLGGKQNSLTAGEGVSLENDTVSIQEPVKEVTQVQYDALTDEEKSKGLYVVTDATINLNDHGDIYSTDETRIGTWIDGKPLYRKGFNFSVYVSGHTAILTDDVVGIKISTIDSVIDQCGYAYSPTTSDSDSLGGWLFTIWRNGLSGAPLCIHSNDTSSDHYVSGVAVIKYTKTTDPTPASQTSLLTSQVPLPDKVTVDTSTLPLTVTFPSTVVTASASASSARFTFAPASATASASSTHLTL